LILALVGQEVRDVEGPSQRRRRTLAGMMG